MCGPTGSGASAAPDVPDGKSYVEAVNAAGQRSRALIYFILILTVLTFATMRNSYDPDWVEKRYRTREQVFTCFVNNRCDEFNEALVNAGMMKKNPSEEERSKALKRASDAIGIKFEKLRPAKSVTNSALQSGASATTNPAPQPGTSAPASPEIDNWDKRELTLTIEAMIKREIDNDTIALPLLGTVIDINDLWIVSGGIMFFLLYFLRASQKQEERNIRYVCAHKPAFEDLVAMNQVLTPHGIGVGNIGKVLEWGFGLLPSFLYIYLAVLDFGSVDISLLDIGRAKTVIEYVIEALLIGVVVYNNILCLRNQGTIRGLIKAAYLRVSAARGTA